MEVTYDVELPEAISQMAYGELKTTLEVTIKNAEALPTLTKGKMWWGQYDNKFFIDYEPDYYHDKLELEDAIAQSVNKIALAKRTKDIVVDAEEIIKNVLEAREKAREKEEEEKRKKEIEELKAEKKRLENRINEMSKYVRRLILHVDDEVLEKIFDLEFDVEEERELTDTEKRVMDKLFG